jgi:hypothetical protein
VDLLDAPDGIFDFRLRKLRKRNIAEAGKECLTQRSPRSQDRRKGAKDHRWLRMGFGKGERFAVNTYEKKKQIQRPGHQGEERDHWPLRGSHR